MLQRAHGKISADWDNQQLRDLYQSGCAKLILPKNHQQIPEAVLINTAGGIADGDVLYYNISLHDKSQLTVTSQAAERVYGAVHEKPANMTVNLLLGEDCFLQWLPQEMILFNQSRIKRYLNIAMHPSARLLMAESVIFGRHLMNERVENCVFADCWNINQDNHIKHKESLEINDNISEFLTNKAGLNHHQCYMTLLYIGADSEKFRLSLDDFYSKTHQDALKLGYSFWQDKMIIRILADDGFILKSILTQILKDVLITEIPKSWRT